MNSERLPPISDFVKGLMPDASEAEQRQAEMNWDRFLDVIDSIYERIIREEARLAERDELTAGDRVEP